MDNDYRQRSGLAKIQPLQAGGQPLRQPLKGDDMGRRKKKIKTKTVCNWNCSFCGCFLYYSSGY